jgi:F0F1-type ATP synthase epsilon subunit
MAKLFNLSILGRDSELYRGNISSLQADFGLGRAEILADHAAFAALTKPGSIKLRDEQDKTVFLELHSPGFFHILGNRAVFILRS